MDGAQQIVDLLTKISFMIADKQEGPFQLKIDWVKANKPALYSGISTLSSCA